MNDETACGRCGWDPRGSDRFHRCRTLAGGLVGLRVAAPARSGGEIFGRIVEVQNGASALVKFDGHLSAVWRPLSYLRRVDAPTSEAA